MKLKHMVEPKSETGKNSPGGLLDSKQNGPNYPWGLRLNLNHDTLQKLGVKGNLKAGDHVHIHAKAHVISSSTNTNTNKKGAKTNHSAELQIHHMAVSNSPNSAKDAVDQGVADADKDFGD